MMRGWPGESLLVDLTVMAPVSWTAPPEPSSSRSSQVRDGSTAASSRVPAIVVFSVGRLRRLLGEAPRTRRSGARDAGSAPLAGRKDLRGDRRRKTSSRSALSRRTASTPRPCGCTKSRAQVDDDDLPLASVARDPRETYLPIGEEERRQRSTSIRQDVIRRVVHAAACRG